MSEERPTPRTDAEALWPASNDGSDTYEPGGAYVTSDFARELERESDARLGIIAGLQENLDLVRDDNAKLREALGTAREAIEDARRAIIWLVRKSGIDFERLLPNETRPTIREALAGKEGA